MSYLNYRDVRLFRKAQPRSNAFRLFAVPYTYLWDIFGGIMIAFIVLDYFK